MNEILDILQREFVYIWYYFDVQLRQIIGYWVLGILLGIVPASFWELPLLYVCMARSPWRPLFPEVG